MKGRKLAPHTRMMVNPGSREVYLQAMREGLIDTMVRGGRPGRRHRLRPLLRLPPGHAGARRKRDHQRQPQFPRDASAARRQTPMWRHRATVVGLRDRGLYRLAGRLMTYQLKH